MCSFRTFVAVFLLFATSASAGGAQHQLIRDFAACAGRFSATMERQWMLQIPGSEDTARKRAAFADLVAAILPSAKSDGLAPRTVLNWRIEAKFAQARLLRLGDFGTELDARGAAHDRAERLLSQCDQMLLSS